MLNVVWIVPGFSSNESDWCIPALLDLARAMAHRCDLKIVAMRYPYRRETYTIGKATVTSIGGAHRGPAHTPGIWRDTVRAVNNGRVDILHAFWAYEPGLIAAWFSSRLPVIISLAGGELVYLPEIQYGLMGKWRTAIPIRWALRRARVVTAGSNFLLRIAQKEISHKSMFHIPLGVDLGRWHFSRLEACKCTVLNVGSLESVKGQEVLLRAFREALQQIPSARLRLVGAGGKLGQLGILSQELGCKEQVEFAGQVPHGSLAACYADASVFAQSSRYEAQGMALLEAAASGLPIVGTGVGALGDLAPVAALATRVGDSHELAKAIITTLENPREAARRAGVAREIVEDTYSLVKAADRLMELYQNLVC